jgi:predicted RNA-binding Zn-ribbon protein involved in translation (DUF1610 family)
MKDRADDSGRPAVPTLAAVCGLFCEGCSIFIASQEDPERLALLAARMGWSVEETYCDGCRAKRRTVYCRSCTMFACAAERGLAFCSQCDEYPCEDFRAFGAERPHRADIEKDLARIGEIGAEIWMDEMRRRYACPACGAINSAYDLKCRRCGHEPGNAFVEEHREAIVARLSQL